VLALARAFNQEPHIWAPLDKWSSRRQNYPTSESCMEAAIRLLGRKGFQPLDWSVAAQYQLHYAQWQRHNYESIHAVAETTLEDSGLRKRFESDFGGLRSLIIRERFYDSPPDAKRRFNRGKRAKIIDSCGRKNGGPVVRNRPEPLDCPYRLPRTYLFLVPR
jgi:hypothetical protein